MVWGLSWEEERTDAVAVSTEAVCHLLYVLERPSLPNSQNYIKLQMALKTLVLWFCGCVHKLY